MTARAATCLAPLALATACDAAPDWREGTESVEQCLERLDRPEMAKLMRSEDPWVPIYVYDVTKMSEEARSALIVPPDGDGPGTLSTFIAEGASERASDEFHDTPATRVGAFLHSEEKSVYKVRGEADLYRDLERQGCEAQRAGMRLTYWSAARESALVDGELPGNPISSAAMRQIRQNVEPSLSDLLP